MTCHWKMHGEKVKMRLRKPRDLAVLQSIAAWREAEARKLNKPRGRI